MLELYQFPHSAFCLKVRMALKVKNLSYRIINVTPGIGQIKTFRLSGQRQVPILVDGSNIIFDSTEIVEYLDQNFQGPKLIPEQAKHAAQAHLIEDWADTTLAQASRAELIKAASIDKDLLIALLPNEIQNKLRKVASHLSLDVIKGLTNLVNQEKISNLLTHLEYISNLVKTNRWIVGESISIADIAIAAQLSLIKFPSSSGNLLAGKGSKGFSDNPKLISLFEWRDQLDIELMQNDPAVV